MTTPSPRERHLFTARLPSGIMGLSLPTCQPLQGQPAGRIMLDAAAALYHAERWLSPLQDWLGQGVLPSLMQVTQPDPESLLFKQHVVLSSPALHTQLHLPLAALLRLSKPPAFLESWSWQTLPCELIVDAVPLAQADLLAVEPGALILLPASFGAQWGARLQPLLQEPAKTVLFTAGLAPLRGQLGVYATGQHAAKAPDAQATVRFRTSVWVSAPALLGWLPDKTVELDVPNLLARNAILVQTSAMTHNKAFAIGQIIPVAEGFAICVHERCQAGVEPSAIGSASVEISQAVVHAQAA
jgi:hypothetical protein